MLGQEATQNQYGLQATQTAEDIVNNYLNQAQVLGASQRGYEQYAQNMSMRDLLRLMQEESMYSNQASQYLGQGAATPSQLVSSAINQWGQPNIYDYINAGVSSSTDDIMNLFSILGMS